jgi:hypothetical protein
VAGSQFLNQQIVSAVPVPFWLFGSAMAALGTIL